MLRLMVILLFGCSWLPNAALANDLLELGCHNDTDCQQYEHAKCHNSHCQCTASAEGNEQVTCKPKELKYSNIIGGACTKEHTCTQPYTVCEHSTEQCYCGEHYMPSDDKRRCIPRAVALDDACELTMQCQAKDRAAVCHPSQKSCMCKEHFDKHEQRCVALLDVSCRNDTVCSALDAICLTKLEKCACIAGHVHNPNMTMCLPGVAYGDNCTTNAQCKLTLGNGAACTNNTCLCSPKHYTKISSENDTICAADVAYGGYCRRQEDCEESAEPLQLQCKWGECMCRDNYQVVDNAHCVPEVKTATASQLFSQYHLLALLQIFWLIY
ncbi:multiple epidermal growth factor-like domains protein 10 [Drosophila nasuta]|uniref:multiple epidermal growth factor-like domains protein 10 n=1 Tax=Drosophila nasuta TaxID=42062 RepID=UPI00295ED86F|nr:multiple epidermal growth factor-like domains protein 10 [Drosophila nasuta]